MKTLAKRNAFTLIELLVVIAVIGILASMLVAAVMKVMEKIPITRTSTEFGQMAIALDAFKADYNADYIPSRIRLCRFGPGSPQTPYNMANQLDSDSVSYITRTIGRNQPSFTTAWKSGIMWNSAGTADETLEGHQCLVFFIGGLQTNAGGAYKCNGFPANWTDMTSVTAPRFQFQPARLSPPSGKTFCAYQDSYGKGQFYAFFSAYKKADGYNRYGSSDCATINPTTNPQGVWPYASSPGTAALVYVNSNSYQIICAGADGVFGPGSVPSGPNSASYYWNSGFASAIGTTSPNAPDDQANFANGKLQYYP